MQTLELNALVDENHELHLKLPDKIKQGWVRDIVEYEDVPTEVGSAHTRKLGLFKGKGVVPDDFNDPFQMHSGKDRSLTIPNGNIVCGKENPIGSCKHSARIGAPNPLTVESMMRY